MRRPSLRSAPAFSVPRQIFASSAPVQRPFVSGGRAYGGCRSALTRTIEPSGSRSRIPLTAASPVMPPPTIK